MKCVPSKEIKANFSKPWHTHRLEQKKNKLKRLKIQSRKCSLKLEQFLDLSMEFSKDLKEARETYENKTIQGADQNKIYSHMKAVRGNDDMSVKCLKKDGKLITDSEEIANILNENYSKVFNESEFCQTSWSNTENNTEGPTLTEIQLTPLDVKNTIRSLKTKSSPGLDGLTPIMFKAAKNELSDTLCDFFNNLMENTVVPSAHKEGVVIPIFKAGDRTIETNYRGVQKNSTLQKIQDKANAKKIADYLEENDLMDKHQHGFRKKYSCETNLLDSWNYMVNQRDQGGGTTLAMVDYSKAFDKVPHHLMMSSIASLGIGGKVGRWLNTWITGRTQQVEVAGKLSRKVPITSGTIQGSNLGPLLYSIFVIDMTKDLKSPYSLYADDLKLYGDTSTLEGCQELQTDLDTLSNWAENHGMKINTDKSHLLPIGSKQNELPFTLAKGILPWAKEAKDLGIILNANMKFNRHVQTRASKCYQLIGQIKRTIKTRKPETLLKLWNTLVLPIITYGSSMWYQETPGINQELQKIYKRFWKMQPKNCLAALSPVEEIKRLSLLTMKRIMSGNTAIKAESYLVFSRRNDEGENKNKFIQKRSVKTLPARENFFNRIINVWNKVKAEYKLLPYEKFKIIAREIVVGENRSETLPNTSAAISARVPKISVF